MSFIPVTPGAESWALHTSGTARCSRGGEQRWAVGKVDVTSDTRTLHPPMASLQPLLVLLILQGQDEGMQGQRDEGRLLCFPSPMAHGAFSAAPLGHSTGARELCPPPKHPEGSGERVHTRAHPHTPAPVQAARWAGSCPPCPAPATHTGLSSLSLPTPRTSNSAAHGVRAQNSSWSQ